MHGHGGRGGDVPPPREKLEIREQNPAFWALLALVRPQPDWPDLLLRSCTVPAVECSNGAKNAPNKGPNASCPSDFVFLDRRVSIVLLYTLENITSEAPANF